MQSEYIVELDDDAEMIDLGIASIETEGGGPGDVSEPGTAAIYYSSMAN